MNEGARGRRGRRRIQRIQRIQRRDTGLLAIAALVALLAAACSASPSGGSSGGAPAAGASASPSADGSGGSSPTARPVTEQKQFAYSECMREHGVPGVPTSLPAPALGKPPSTLNAKPGPANGPNPGSPQWQAAQQACRSLAPSPVRMSGS
jgi:hypothetical protein